MKKLLYVKYDDLIEKLVQCAYSFRSIETWEDVIAIVNEIPTWEVEPSHGYNENSTNKRGILC